MNNDKFPFLILDHSKSHIDEDSDFSENEYKNKNFKIDKYEKFKPKSIINKEKKYQTLKREENKVKDLLSNFLKNMESEDNSVGFDFKPVNTLKMKGKDKDTISIRKRIKKIKTATNKKISHIKRTNSYNVNKDKFTDNYIVYKNTENNKFKLDESTPKSSIFTNNPFHKKKVGFNLNPNTNIKPKSNNNEIRRNSILKKRSKIVKNIKICISPKNKQKRNSDKNKIQRINSYTEYNKINLKPFTIEASRGNINRKFSYKKDNSIKTHLNNINSKIKKTKSLTGSNTAINFKNEGFVLTKIIGKRKKKMSLKNNLYNFGNGNTPIKKKKNVFNDSNFNSLYSGSSDCIKRISIESKKKKQ